MKTCPKCGRPWAVTVRFCPMDGMRLPEATPPPEAKVIDRKSANDPLLGQVFENKYLILAKIGQGGTGSIYRAQRANIGDYVAIKVLKPELVADYAATERFRREALALGRIHHPNAISIYDFGVSANGTAFLVMEFLSGKTLRQILQAEKCLELRRAVHLLGQMCAALNAAHRSNIVHRDLKPENIMVEWYEGQGEVAKVIDFGLARLKLTGKLVQTLTAQGRVAGTPYYMSPEQWMDKPLDARTDVYALGVILYEMLTGQVPFQASSVIQLASKHVRTPPSPPILLRRDLPVSVSEIVMSALAKEPAGRPATTLELAERLNAAIAVSLSSPRFS
jgi:eukaryotic-like serine/threonine-protein kinase